MFRTNLRKKYQIFENLSKRYSSRTSSDNRQLTPRQLFEEKYNGEYQRSALFPAVLGISALTLLTSGLAYHYSEDTRDTLAPYLSTKTKKWLDDYLGPHNFSKIKKKIPSFELGDMSSMFSDWTKKITMKDKSEVEPISTKIKEIVAVPLSGKKGDHKNNKEKEADRIRRQYDELTRKLADKSTEIDIVATSAVKYLSEYETKIQEHSEKLRRAIDDDGKTIPNPWEDVNTTSQQQNSAKNKSESEMKRVEAVLNQFERLLNESEKSPDLQSNPSIQVGRQLIVDTRYKLKQKQADIEKAQFNAQITNQYKELIQQGRERFRQELSSLSPNVSNWTRKQSDQLTTDDLNAMIVHSHRRMNQLQARIAELEAMEAVRLEAALTEQRKSDEQLMNERIEREIERERMLAKVSKISELDSIKEKHETELRRALTRQASAHNEHINQLLRIQKEELDKQQDLLIREALIKERERMRGSIEGWRMRVEGLEAAVEGRADEELVSREAQDMWVACHALHGILSGPAQTPPLARYLTSFEEAAQPSSLPVLKVFIESVPRCAVEEGVCTQQLLARRFDKLKVICRRVAMIDETSASLGMYFVSWLRSIFLVTPAQLIEACTEIDLDDPEAMPDCNLIIASAELAVWRQDFDLAVRLLNLLKGMPRAVAHDWINDARVYLETKLAADALSTYTSSKTAGSAPPEQSIATE